MQWNICIVLIASLSSEIHNYLSHNRVAIRRRVYIYACEKGCWAKEVITYKLVSRWCIGLFSIVICTCFVTGCSISFFLSLLCCVFCGLCCVHYQYLRGSWSVQNQQILFQHIFFSFDTVCMASPAYTVYYNIVTSLFHTRLTFLCCIMHFLKQGD